MSANVAEVFYRAFQGRDHETMSACYTSEARFTDPVFDLFGDEIGHMWRMLCQGSGDLDVQFDIVESSDTGALVDWVASYTFTPTGRQVRNNVQARISVADGMIARHTDLFSFYAWARQAFGVTGAALGWSPPFRRKVRERARAALVRSAANPYPPDARKGE